VGLKIQNQKHRHIPSQEIFSFFRIRRISGFSSFTIRLSIVADATVTFGNGLSVVIRATTRKLRKAGFLESCKLYKIKQLFCLQFFSADVIVRMSIARCVAMLSTIVRHFFGRYEMPTVVEEKKCVVCGQGSHRTSWKNVQGVFVACDGHSPKEFSDAVARTTAPAPTTNGPKN